LNRSSIKETEITLPLDPHAKAAFYALTQMAEVTPDIIPGAKFLINS